MSGSLCPKCNFYVNHCRCETPGEKSLESPEPTEPVKTKPKVHRINKEKFSEVENQKFLIRMGDRIKMWRDANGKAPLPIYKDKFGKLWWANREERKKMAKAKRKNASG